MNLLPLVRLQVESTGFDSLRRAKIESKYERRIANTGEILKFIHNTRKNQPDI